MARGEIQINISKNNRISLTERSPKAIVPRWTSRKLVSVRGCAALNEPWFEEKTKKTPLKATGTSLTECSTKAIVPR